MIDFLKEYGIKEDTLEELEEKYDKAILYNLQVNELEIEKIIRYFKELGINNIDDIILNKTELFLKTFRKIKELFLINSNGTNIISLINENIDNIDLLFRKD